MAISDNGSRDQYTANGATATFAYTFKIFDQDDLQVYIGSTLKTIVTDYSVTDVGVDEGGTVVFTSTPANGERITLQRRVASERQSEYQPLGFLDTSVLNTDFERLWGKVQEIEDQLGRTVALNDSDLPATLTLPLKTARANKALVFDADGNVIASVDDYLDQAADAAASASAAASSASAASASASAASDSATNAASSAADAAASAAALNVPSDVTGAALSMLRVKADATGYELRTPSQVATDIGVGTITADLANTSDNAKGDALVGVKRTNTNAVAMTLHAWLEGQVFNVKEWGAVGNGVTDDYTAINNCINAAISATRATVYFPPGTYRVNSTIGMNVGSSRLTLMGAGPEVSRIVCHANTDWFQLGFTGQPQTYGATVQDLMFEAGITHTSGAAFHIRNAKRIKFLNCHFNNPNKMLQLGNDSVVDDVVDVKVLDCYAQGGTNSTTPFIHLRSGAILDVSRCFFNGTGLAYLFGQLGGDAQNWDGLTFTDCTCEQWRRHISAEGKGVSNVRMHGNIVDRPVDYSILAAPFAGGLCQQWTITGNVFQGPSAVDATNVAWGIRIAAAGSRARDWTITGNSFFQFGGIGVAVETSAKGVTVQGNIFRDVGFSTGVTGSCIRVDGSTVGITVTGNTGHIILASSGACDSGVHWAAAGTARAGTGNIFEGVGAQVNGAP